MRRHSFDKNSALAGRFMRSVAVAILFPLLGVSGYADNASAQDARTAPGVIFALQAAEIASPVSAKITAAPYRIGDSFQEGDILVSFDCERFKAEQKAARNAAGAAYARLKVNRELDRYGAIGKGEVSASAAEAASAGASAEALAEIVKQCDVVAPFSGRVSAAHVAAFETPNAGDPLISILNDRELAIRMIVPSTWLAWLKPGAAFSFQVVETGQSVAAEVTRIGALVDAVSRTVDVEARLTGDIVGVLPGMSGEARF